jgi:uridine phosphorylase
LNKRFCISSEEVLEEAMRVSKKKKENFKVDPFVILFFSRILLEYFKETVKVKETEWLVPYHPYASGTLFRGIYAGIPVSIISPPMGASSISTVIEDLIYCGAKVILLVCGAWGIRKNIKILDYMIPSYTFGSDGTSIHYNNALDYEIEIDPLVVEILIKETKKRTSNFHLGKNFSKEAFYRISFDELNELQHQGVISMENGELNVLGTISKEKDIRFGAIFYNYYNLLEGWRVPWDNEAYKNCVILETEIAIATIKQLSHELF